MRQPTVRQAHIQGVKKVYFERMWRDCSVSDVSRTHGPRTPWAFGRTRDQRVYRNHFVQEPATRPGYVRTEAPITRQKMSFPGADSVARTSPWKLRKQARNIPWRVLTTPRGASTNTFGRFALHSTGASENPASDSGAGEGPRTSRNAPKRRPEQGREPRKESQTSRNAQKRPP